jgi:hypothetical protein
MSYIVRFAAFAGPQADAVSSGVSAVFALGAYLTKDDGSPNLVGPEVTTAAANLGSNLFDRYRRTSNSIATQAQIVMSDYSKLTEVASRVTSDSRWRLGDVASSTDSMRQATRAAIYQSLVPVAFPYLYDLGWGLNDATQWICRSSSFLVDKKLFQRTGPSAQVIYRVPDPAPRDKHVIAVGARHAVGSLKGAYVPAPTDTLTKQLFSSPTSPHGGVGLQRLQFYSPRYFRMFSPVLQQTSRKIDPFRGPVAGFWTCQDLPNPPGNSG